MTHRKTLFALAGVLAATAFAQDSLFYTNGNVIVGEVEEIGLEVIKYRTSSEGRQIVIAVNKEDLSSVKLKNGQAYSFNSPDKRLSYSENFLGRKNAVAVDLIAPALNHVTIAYERVLGPRISLVVKAGYIGLWKGDGDRFNRRSSIYDSEQGALISGGIKFKLPRFAGRTTQERDAHPLAGWYLRPEFMFSAWKGTSSYLISDNQWQAPWEVPVNCNFTSAALVLSIGREWFFGEHITFDMNGGLGYGGQWCDAKSTCRSDRELDRQDYAFSHHFMTRNTRLVLSGGLRFGYAF